MGDPFEVGGTAHRASSRNQITLYNDACEDPVGRAGAFRDIRRAIEDAKHFVFIVDWSFHPEMHLLQGGPRLGELLARRAVSSKDLLIAVHVWNHTNFRDKGDRDEQNDGAARFLSRFLATELQLKNAERVKAGQEPLPLPGASRWTPTNLLFRCSSRTGLGFSHHQKFIALDVEGPGGKRMVAVFFGGLDLTKGRFDFRTHRILPQDEDVKWMLDRYPDGGQQFDEWYNKELDPFSEDPVRLVLPRQPWHDVHGRLVGPAAWDFVREFVGRWTSARQADNDTRSFRGEFNGQHGDADSLFLRRPVLEKYDRLLRSAAFIQQSDLAAYPAQGAPFKAQVVHSLVKENVFPLSLGAEQDLPRTMEQEFPWTKDFTFRRQVEATILDAYRAHIARAERFIYIENQFLIGSGQDWKPEEDNSIRNDIPKRLVQRIIGAHDDGDPFHVYVVLPLFPEGSPTDLSSQGVRYNQWRTIDFMVRSLHDRMGDAWERYLSFYFLAQWSNRHGTPAFRAKRPALMQAEGRYMIYVHTKMMICDDRTMVLGSCNLNERGLAGDRDSEIDVSLWPEKNREAECQAVIQNLRFRLWSEHLGLGLGVRPLEGGFWKTPEAPETILKVQALARDSYRNFRNNTRRDQSCHLCAWPILFDGREISLGVVTVDRTVRKPGTLLDFEHELLPDQDDFDLGGMVGIRDPLKRVQKVRDADSAIRPLDSHLGRLTE